MTGKNRFAIIKSLEQMCYAGKAATAYYLKVCEANPDIIGKASYTPAHLRACNLDLESTYLIRMFAEFERQLRDCWLEHFDKRKRPTVRALINRFAARYRMPSDVLKRTHAVREYRNSLVHEGTALPLTLPKARSYLCKFLADLPRN